MLEISKSDLLLLIEDLEIECPSDFENVAGLLERSGEDAQVGVFRGLPSTGVLMASDAEGIAELPKPWAVKYLSEHHKDALFMSEEFDGAFVGVWFRCGRLPVAVYDRGEVIRYYANQGDDTPPEYGLAVEHFEFNIGGAYIGAGTPAFLTRYVD